MSVRLGFVLLVLAVVAGVVGYQYAHPGPFDPAHLIADFYPGLSSMLALVALTVLAIGGLYEHRERRRERIALVEEMASRDNGLALRAVERMRKRGWLVNGSLRGARFAGANLYKAYLWGADLRGVNLEEADLRECWLASANLHSAYLRNANLRAATLHAADLTGAYLGGARLGDATLRGAILRHVTDLTDEQLASAARLGGATLPDGTRYDGRYNLPGDLTDARAAGVNLDDPTALARWYGVSPEVFGQGQAWAASHDATPASASKVASPDDDTFSTRAITGYGKP